MNFHSILKKPGFFLFFNQNVQNSNFVMSKHILTGQIPFAQFVAMVRTR